MKYDRRIEEQYKVNIENIHPQTNYPKQDVFTSLHEAGTTSSKAKEAPKKEKVISVQITRPQPDKQKHTTTTNTLTNLSKTATETLSCCHEQCDKVSEKAESVLSHRVKSVGNVDRISTQTLKPKTSCMSLNKN